MLSASNEKYCSWAQLNQKVFNARIHTCTSSMSIWQRGVWWWLNTTVTGANTPREIKLSFRPQPLLNTRSGIDQLSGSVCECVCGWERVWERRWGGAGWSEKTEKKRGGKLIYLLLMMVIHHQICRTPDLFVAPGQLEKFFLCSLENTAQYTPISFNF